MPMILQTGVRINSCPDYQQAHVTATKALFTILNWILPTDEQRTKLNYINRESEHALDNTATYNLLHM